MKPEVLALRPIYAAAQAKMDDRYVVHKSWQAQDPEQAIISVASRIRALVTLGTVGVASEIMDALPNLEIIASAGAGTGMIDLQHAKQRGIAVTNTPDGKALADSVADLALGMMLSLCRKICEGHRYVRAGKWPSGQLPLGHTFSGKHLGIVGMGAIGSSVARRAEGFGLEISYHGRRIRNELGYRFYPDLPTMARDVDVLLVCCPATPQTRHLIDETVLSELGAKGFLVNVARGSIVDTAALVRALASATIMGAALDVFDDEPNVAPELVALDNVLLTPHIGSSTHEIRSARGALVLANLQAHFSGESLPSRVV